MQIKATTSCSFNPTWIMKGSIESVDWFQLLWDFVLIWYRQNCTKESSQEVRFSVPVIKIRFLGWELLSVGLIWWTTKIMMGFGAKFLLKKVVVVVTFAGGVFCLIQEPMPCKKKAVQYPFQQISQTRIGSLDEFFLIVKGSDKKTQLKVN